jgi:hypothetical protein
MKTIRTSIRPHCLARMSIFLTAAALIVGMAGCAGCGQPRSQNLEIRTWYDLDAVRDNLAGHHTLMNDLDSTTPGYEGLAGGDGNDGMGWLPIGTEDDAFTGSLDGQGYEIRDLFMVGSGLSHVGVFGFVGEGGRIEDIGVVDAEVIGDEVAGGLVAVCYGTVTDSCFAGAIYGHDCAGGLVGENYGAVTDSYSTCSVTGEAVAGGLVGWNQGMVRDSYGTGNVIGGFVFVGGLVGLNEGTVTGSYSGGDVSGSASDATGIGGLVGGNGHSGPGTVTNSYSTGRVTGEDNVGGLVGVNWPKGNVSDCYATGNVDGEREVGGLVGGNAGTVSDSYSTGSVTGNQNIGGLVGASYGTVSNCSWDTETSGQASSDGGTGKTTAEMRNVDTFSDARWHIIAVADSDARNAGYTWNIVDGQTYPFLSWEVQIEA